MPLFTSTKWEGRNKAQAFTLINKGSSVSSPTSSKILGDALLHATFLINRIPTAVLNWKCPYEILHKSKPNLDQIKSFGCLCYASNLAPNKTKLDPKAFKCIFLGNSQNNKGYKLYCLETQSNLISRDVVFYEDVFPFEYESQESREDRSAPQVVPPTHTSEMQKFFIPTSSDEENIDTHESVHTNPPCIPDSKT